MQRQWRWPDSLLFRAVAGLMLIISLVTAVMFMSIDRFVSAQFGELSQQRILNQIADMQQQLQSEREGLMTLGQLISTDSDLRQSAQYHLFLEGERRPLEMDVARIASAFRFDLFGVWDVTGRPVAHSPCSYGTTNGYGPQWVARLWSMTFYWPG